MSVKLFVLVLLTAVGCSSQSSPPSSTAVSSPPSPSPTAAPIAVADRVWAEAVNKAMSAAMAAQTAKTSAQWGEVVDQWRSALLSMEWVPDTNPHHAEAQTKVQEYRKNLSYAMQRERLTTAATKPLSPPVAVAAQPTVVPPKAEPEPVATPVPASSPEPVAVVDKDGQMAQIVQGSGKSCSSVTSQTMFAQDPTGTIWNIDCADGNKYSVTFLSAGGSRPQVFAR